MALMLQTWEMIKDNPLGVGADYFEFSLVPYKNVKSGFPPQEQILEKSPHNEFLRFLAEDGIILTLLGIFFLFRQMYINRKLIFNLLKKESGCHALALTLFLVPEFLFQFPLQTPFPFLMILILSGFFLSNLFYEKQRLGENPVNKKVVLGFLIIYLMVFFPHTFAKYIERNYYYNYSLTSFACKISPFNWRVCSNKGQLELREKNFLEAERTFRLELKKRPNNFVALKFLGLSLYDQDKQQNGCSKLKDYDILFLNKSSLHEFVKNNCLQY